MRISDWSSDVCSSDLIDPVAGLQAGHCGTDNGDLPGRIQAESCGQVGQRVLREPVGPVLEDVAKVRHNAAGADSHQHVQRRRPGRSEEHTSELQPLMRIPYSVICMKKQKTAIKIE